MVDMPEIGDPLPWIMVPTTREPLLPLNGLAGHRVIIGVAGPEIDSASIVTALENAATMLGDLDAYWLVVTGALPDNPALPSIRNPRGRLLPDPDGTTRRALGVSEVFDGMVSLRANPGLRVTECAHHQGPKALQQAEHWLAQALTSPEQRHAGPEVDAPVLMIPDVIEAALRDRLIAAWSEDGHEETGYLRQDGDGSVIHVVNPARKRRSDHFLDEADALTALVHARIRHRVAPWVERATHFRIGFAERYRVACYEAETSGFFAPHRDFSDTSPHRHFAMTIALNDGFAGGGLRFPEFGSR
ncbi:MAG: hypothetical protein O3B74_01400, partial [Proteobacteria bacterium]|nr:hypothetical protein [Pseudomonadota bacterium]